MAEIAKGESCPALLHELDAPKRVVRVYSGDVPPWDATSGGGQMHHWARTIVSEEPLKICSSCSKLITTCVEVGDEVEVGDGVEVSGGRVGAVCGGVGGWG